MVRMSLAQITREAVLPLRETCIDVTLSSAWIARNVRSALHPVTWCCRDHPMNDIAPRVSRGSLDAPLAVLQEQTSNSSELGSAFEYVAEMAFWFSPEFSVVISFCISP